MKKIFLTIIGVFVLLTSCDVNENLNIDQKHPDEVAGATLFNNAARNLFDQMNDCSVNTNVLRLYAQYWAQTTYPEESQYTQVTRNIGGNIWIIIYRDVLKDLEGARKSVENSVDNPDKDNQLAIIEFINIYAYSILVDTFGDVPYSEALDFDNPSPKYDDAQTIYMDLLQRLDAAIGSMGNSSGSIGFTDIVYDGSVSYWKQAASSLLLRMAMRIADVDPTNSEMYAHRAIDYGVITNSASNFGIKYYAAYPNTNPLWVQLIQSGRSDYVAANTLVDAMNNLNDPRRYVYFRENLGADVFDGGVYGDANSYSGYTHLGSILEVPDLEGTIISAAEVDFLLAEYEERFNSGTNAEMYYDNGIRASFAEWGLFDSNADSYLLQSDVAYTTATGDWKQKIATQKWLALFNNGMEGWTTWRIFNQPTLNPPPDMTLGDVPTRFLYPISEAQLNGPNYDAAASAIGGDSKTTRLFWDIN
ncbi:MAG: SusD/RagB family nutrient-binding outer membrane lipoprotein [Flavobacteriaceae bacterium]|nr:SusD/RagB family nutrient-binding outer membrane lipoprotein [Flavobacteriaceae bacterium]